MQNLSRMEMEHDGFSSRLRTYSICDAPVSVLNHALRKCIVCGLTHLRRARPARRNAFGENYLYEAPSIILGCLVSDRIKGRESGND